MSSDNSANAHPQLRASTKPALNGLARIVMLSGKLLDAVNADDHDTFVRLYAQRRPMIEKFEKEYAPLTWPDVAAQYGITLHDNVPSEWMEGVNKA